MLLTVTGLLLLLPEVVDLFASATAGGCSCSTRGYAPSTPPSAIHVRPSWCSVFVKRAACECDGDLCICIRWSEERVPDAAGQGLGESAGIQGRRARLRHTGCGVRGLRGGVPYGVSGTWRQDRWPWGSTRYTTTLITVICASSSLHRCKLNRNPD